MGKASESQWRLAKKIKEGAEMAIQHGHDAVAHRPISDDEKRVIFASSLGTVFEWYDFYLFGVMAVIIDKNFFSALDDSTRTIFTLLAFAAGFAVRPFGAIVFGRLGDLIGRKYTFLVTILIMGLSTCAVGLLPTYATWGIAAPAILISLRLLQGLALGGEYGGENVKVAPLVEIIRFSGDVGKQIEELPDGAQVHLKVVP